MTTEQKQERTQAPAPEAPKPFEVVYSFKRNEFEEVWLSVREYKGRKYLDIRLFYLPQDGSSEYRATKKGITIPMDSVPDLMIGLEKVVHRLGLHK